MDKTAHSPFVIVTHHHNDHSYEGTPSLIIFYFALIRVLVFFCFYIYTSFIISIQDYHQPINRLPLTSNILTTVDSTEGFTHLEFCQTIIVNVVSNYILFAYAIFS